jgi:hypothetical protein
MPKGRAIVTKEEMQSKNIPPNNLSLSNLAKVSKCLKQELLIVFDGEVHTAGLFELVQNLKENFENFEESHKVRFSLVKPQARTGKANKLVKRSEFLGDLHKFELLRPLFSDELKKFL